jgi:hypothetical protein
MTKLYRIRNTTKNEWVFVESETPPTNDPNNQGDAVDLDSVAVIRRVFEGATVNELITVSGDLVNYIDTSTSGTLEGIEVSISSEQPFSSTFSDINFDVQNVYNGTAINHSTTVDNERFYLEKDGIYKVHMDIGAGYVGSLDTRRALMEVRALLNGSTVIEGSNGIESAVTPYRSFAKSFTITATSGQYLTFQFREDTPTDHSLLPGSTTICIELCQEQKSLYEYKYESSSGSLDDAYAWGNVITLSGNRPVELTGPVDDIRGDLKLSSARTNQPSSAQNGELWILDKTFYGRVDGTSLGVRQNSFAQADFVLGTDLDTTRNELELEVPSAVSLGGLFTVNSNNITIAKPGIYKVNWSCCAYLPTTSRDRKTLLTDLNLNSGNYITATLQGGYVRDGAESSHASTGGTYYITTTSVNETIALRARRQGDTGQTFPVTGGFLSVELVELS